MAEIYSKGLKPGKNVWVYLLVAYLPISMLFAPAPFIDLVGINVMGFWAWQPFAKIIIFALLFSVISSHEFTTKDIHRVLNVMVWCGFLTSLYELTQFFYSDQFFIQCADGNWGRIAGFIGNPTLTAPFVAMLIPIALYLKKYPMAAIMFVGAVIPDSQMAWVALVAGLSVYYALKGPKWFIFSVLSWIFFFFFVIAFFHHGQHLNNKYLRSLFEDHERLMQWKQIFKDWTGPLAADKGVMNNFSLTGRGLGSFRYVYHIQHANIGAPNRFFQAHNDYLECGYAIGFIGVGLFIGAICHMIKRNVSMQAVLTIGESRYNRALIASMATIAVNAFGTFVWQIGTLAMYSVIIAGLLHNNSFVNEECSV